VLASIGYRLLVERVRLPRTIFWGNAARLSLTLNNRGIAPFYYPWPLVVYVLDVEGALLVSFPLDVDMRALLPDTPLKVSARLPVADLPDGNYTLAVALLDPLTAQPAVRFAMPNPRPDRIQELASFKVHRLFRNLFN